MNRVKLTGEHYRVASELASLRLEHDRLQEDYTARCQELADWGKLAAEARRLLEWLVNTCSDIGRDGNPVTMNEHIEAVQAGRTFLSGEGSDSMKGEK